MRKIAGVLLFIGAHGVGVVRVSAQQIGQVSVRLGEPKEAVVSRLRLYYLVVPASSDTLFWSISDTTKWNGTPNYGNVGHVQFRNGVLTSATRPWNEKPTTPVETVALLASALRQLDSESECTVKSQRSQQPESQFDLIQVRCGAHLITLGTSTEAGNRFSQISESWVSGKP